MASNIFFLSLFFNAAGFFSPITPWSTGQEVSTSSGKVAGHASKWQPEVSEYLGIPFALPPLGESRFAAPKPFTGNGTIKAEKARKLSALDQGFGFFGLNATRLTPGITRFDEGVGRPTDEDPHVYSEDCLTLNVWTKPQTGEKSKAVFVWIYGGGYTVGGSHAPFYNGARLANEEDIIVVSINYRVNIFGFSRAPGLPNVGFLDQRLAIEWIRDNIAGFGGDPKRITIGGESAGGFSVDTYSYIWIDDPIINGIIAESGTSLTAMNLAQKPNTAEKHWFKFTNLLGCGGAEAGLSTIDCMRKIPATKIMETIQIATGNVLVGPFQPVIDNKTLFSDTRARADAGKFLKKPMLLGVNDDEFGVEVAMPGTFGPTVSAIINPGGGDTGEGHKVGSDFAFNCPTAYTAATRKKHSVPVWRYRYMPVWPNMALVPSIGAYHAAEIPSVFGSNQLTGNVTADTPDQEKLSQIIRHAWAEFTKDPEKGLMKLGWPIYDPKEDSTLIRLGYQNTSEVNFGPSTEYDGLCATIDTMDGILELIGN